MNKQINHIDNLFREGLSGYTETPPPSVWDSLEERLDDKDKKRAGFFYRRRWILLLLAFVSVFSSLMAWRMAGGFGSFAGTRELPVQENTPLQSTTSNTAIGASSSAPVDGSTAMNETTGTNNNIGASNNNPKPATGAPTHGDKSTVDQANIDATENGRIDGTASKNPAPNDAKDHSIKGKTKEDGAFAMADVAEPNGKMNEEKPAPKLEVIRYIVKKSMSNNIQIAEAEPVLGIAEHQEPELLSEPGADDEEHATAMTATGRTAPTNGAITVAAHKRTTSLAKRNMTHGANATNTALGSSAGASRHADVASGLAKHGKHSFARSRRANDVSLKRLAAKATNTGNTKPSNSTPAHSQQAYAATPSRLDAKAPSSKKTIPANTVDSNQRKTDLNKVVASTTPTKRPTKASKTDVASTASSTMMAKGKTMRKKGSANTTAAVTLPTNKNPRANIDATKTTALVTPSAPIATKTNAQSTSRVSSRTRKESARKDAPAKLATMSRANHQQRIARVVRLHHAIRQQSKTLNGSDKEIAKATSKSAISKTKQVANGQLLAHNKPAFTREQNINTPAATAPIKWAAYTGTNLTGQKTSAEHVKEAGKTDIGDVTSADQPRTNTPAEHRKNNRSTNLNSAVVAQSRSQQSNSTTSKQSAGRLSRSLRRGSRATAVAADDPEENELSAAVPVGSGMPNKKAARKKQSGQSIATAGQHRQPPTRNAKPASKPVATQTSGAMRAENNPQATTELAAAPTKITLPIPGTFKEDTMPFTMKPKAADTTASAAPAAAKVDSPQTIKNGHRGYEIGIKGGYEGGFTNDAARKMIISPYFEKQISDKWSFLTQPAIKISTLAGRALSGSQSFYKDVDSSVSNTGTYNITLVIGSGGTAVIDTVVRTNYLYSKTVDYLSKTYSIGGTYIELEMPLLMKYKITDKLSVYGGFTLNYSRTIRIKEATDNNGEIIVNKLLPTYSHPGVSVAPQAISAVLQPAGNPLSSYSGPLYPNSKNGLFRMGFMFGASYEFKKRYMFDVLMQQGSVKAKMEGGYNINKALSATYFRFTLGYRLFKK